MGGRVFKREYIWWNNRKDWMPLRNVRGLLRTQAATSNIQTQDTGFWGVSEVQTQDMSWQRIGCKRHLNFYQKDIWRAIPKRQREDKTEGYGSSRKQGFSGGSSSDRLTEEQENEIAENIYDWWISGKSYKQWYAEKFQQMKLDFGEF